MKCPENLLAVLRMEQLAEESHTHGQSGESIATRVSGFPVG